ncbi:phosphonoacetaldehyde reductase [Arenimonas sp.]|uniref:phosphonoacetaldehyde reductase n=1 Tax=Arenimonas sp. TaxID=1872635 RepID=UPI0039E6CF21
MSPDFARWQHYNPVRVVAGPGALGELPALLPERGAILLVTTAGFTRRGITGRVAALVERPGERHLVVHDSVTPNPELDDLERAAERHRASSPVAVLAIGGGSAIDAGKAIAAILDAQEAHPLHRVFREGAQATWSGRISLVAVPTTAGTGSEVTPFATVWDQRTHRKFSVAGDTVFPSACVLDPELTLSLGHDDTLYPALDTISHALESLWNRHATPVSEALALGALRIAADALPTVLADGHDLRARAGMQQASMMAGQAISHTRTALAHSISYPLTLHHGVPHGLACSFTLPALLRRHVDALATDPARREVLSRIAGMLAGLGLDEHVRRFATPAQVLALLPQMNTPGRADNFIFAPDTEAVLRESMATSAD